LKPTIAIAFVALLTLLSVEAQSRGTAKELVALESRFSQALLNGDWKLLAQIEADDLIFTNANGSVTRKVDDLAGLQSGDMKFESIDMSDVHVQDFGDVAVVTGRLVEKGRYKTTDLSGTYRFTDVWARRNSRWQLVTGQETLVQTQRR